jgi:hypothetical protein
MISYLGVSGGLDFMQSGDTIFIWARKAWHRFCSFYDWLTTWPGKTIGKVFVAGKQITRKG